MTTERDGKSRRAGHPDLLASLPDERQAPGIDPAAIEAIKELLTEVRDLLEQVAGLRKALLAERPAPVTLEDLREQFAGLRKAVAADRPAPVPEAVPQALTLEALEAWGDRLVARVADAARTADAPADDEVVARLRRIREVLVTVTAAVKRNNGVLNSIVDRSAAEAARTADAHQRTTR